MLREYRVDQHDASIGDVAKWKRHQRLDEIFIFFIHTTSEKSAKLQYTRET